MGALFSSCREEDPHEYKPAASYGTTDKKTGAAADIKSSNHYSGYAAGRNFSFFFFFFFLLLLRRVNLGKKSKELCPKHKTNKQSKKNLQHTDGIE
jgi:hypothetical protein